MDRQSIGSYKIVGELGRGAMGVVYHAMDPAIGRPVAVKVIRLSSDMTADESAQLRQRLIREASAAGKLSHPNLVTVYQLGEENQEVFIAMEFVQGHPLRQLMIHEGGIPQARSLDILRQVADGLDYAHRAGVVHRDVKPDNILIREDGCAKIADFGIAKIIESTTHHMTQAGVSMGSPSYMSPEQVKAEQLDARTDQFSLAVVAFEMLTGRKPFVADSVAALMHQIIVADPLSTQEARTKLSPSMVPAFSRALAKNAADRFPTCSEFVRNITIQAAPSEFQATVTAPVIPPTPATVAPTPAKKTSPLPILAGVVCLLVLLAGVGYWVSHRLAAGSDAKSAEKPAKTESPLVKAIAEGHLDEARNLLSHGTDVNAANPDGTTPLMQAAIGSAYLPKNMPAVQMLLDKNPNLEAEDVRGRTALFRAVEEGQDEVINVLLAHKAEVNHRASDGSTPVLAAVSYGKLPAIKALLAAGGNIETPDNGGKTPLIQAAEGSAYTPNNVPFVQLLIEKGAKVEPQDKQGRSALYLASSEGKAEAVNLLLDQKADPNLKDNNGGTPLLIAVTYGKMDTIKTLLKRGATVDAADSSGTTPLMQASAESAYVPNNGPLVQLLLEAGAKVDLQDARGRSPLYRAAEGGKEEAIRLLIDHKADPNQRPSDGTTPLMAAIVNAKLAAVKLLLDHGADVNLADPNGKTPLMAIADGSPYIANPADYASVLLSKGTKKDAVDDKGRTALARATEAKNTAVIELLKK